MNILTLGARARPVDRFESRGAAVEYLLAAGRSQLVSVELAPFGVLGRHEAEANQVLVVVEGAGTVSGGDGVDVPIEAGTAASWSAGETHETRAGDEGLWALVLEGDFDLPGR